MMIPTEPIGSIPRPPELVAALDAGDLPREQLERLYEEAVRDTVRRIAATGSPVIGVHTCPGAGQDSRRSQDVDHADLLPSLFNLEAGNFYGALAAAMLEGRL